MAAKIEIESFGYSYDAAPDSDVTFDLRRRFDYPYVSPELMLMGADDDSVASAVTAIPGITRLADAAADAVSALSSGIGLVFVTVGCQDGRHLSPVFARMLAVRLTRLGNGHVITSHREAGLWAERRYLPEW